jgi:hypothetical protein
MWRSAETLRLLKFWVPKRIWLNYGKRIATCRLDVHAGSSRFGANESHVGLTDLRQTKSQMSAKTYTHNEVLEQGERLWISAYQNPRTDTFSFRVNGQLPMYTGPARPDLRDPSGREILALGQRPRYLRVNFEQRSEAKSFLHALEQAYNNLKVGRHPVETELTEQEVREYEKLHLRLKPYFSKLPDAIEEAGDLFEETHGNLIKSISLQQLYELMREKEAAYLGKEWLDRIGVAVNAVCRGCGSITDSYDHTGKNKYDMQLGDVTVNGLQMLLTALPFARATGISRPFKRLLRFAKEQGYIGKNVAEELNLRPTRDERIAKAIAEIAIDTIPQVQIALNMAAKYSVGSKPKGYFVPHVVFMYYAAMRPFSELRNLNPTDVQLHKKLIRLWSTKKMKRRIKSLPANAVAILDFYWDGRPLSFEGWSAFWKMVQAAQGYDVRAPGWFKVPPGTNGKPKSDVPRHTGCTHAINRFKNPLEAVREDDHNWEVFRIHYDGLSPVEDTAIFCALFPVSMPLTEDIRTKVRQDLIDHELIKPVDPIPTAPTVPDFDVDPPKLELWLPQIADDTLRDKIWNANAKVVAKELGTDSAWLFAICRAKRIPTPKPGRAGRERPADAPIPPPLINISNSELEKLIKELHGIDPAAIKLAVRPSHLRAYCAVHKVPTPSRTERALYFNNRPRVTTSRHQVQKLLGTAPIEEVAKTLKLPLDYLRAYCQRHQLQMGKPCAEQGNCLNIEDIKAAVAKELHAQPRRVLQNSEAMEIVLSHAPEGLHEDELIRVIAEVIGMKLTTGEIKYVAKESARGRFLRRHGRIRLVGAHETGVDIEHLKSMLKTEARARNDWLLIEALRCLVPKTLKGLSVEELAQLLPLFSIELGMQNLKRELRRLDRQGRVTFYYNRITLPESEPNFRLRVRDREATPGFEEIKKRVQQKYTALANRTFTNVQKMMFVLSMAPNGLWQDEFLEIAEASGFGFKQSCIHSVVEKEAKGQFKCENGRIRFLGTFAERATVAEIRNALPTESAPELPKSELILKVMKSFPQGLTIDDLIAAAELCGHHDSRDTFRRYIYHMAKRGQLQVDDGLVRLSAGLDDVARILEATAIQRAA